MGICPSCIGFFFNDGDVGNPGGGATKVHPLEAEVDQSEGAIEVIGMVLRVGLAVFRKGGKEVLRRISLLDVIIDEVIPPHVETRLAIMTVGSIN